MYVDKLTFITAKELFKKTELVIDDFITGKRVRYFKPLSYIFITTTIYILISYIFNLSYTDIEFKFQKESQINIFGKNYIPLIQKIIDWNKNNYTYSALLMLPLQSIITYFLFRNNNKNYVEHLILNSYLQGQIMIIVLFMIPFKYFDEKYFGGSKIIIIQNIISIFYSWFFFSRVFRHKTKTYTVFLLFIYEVLKLFVILLYYIVSIFFFELISMYFK